MGFSCLAPDSTSPQTCLFILAVSRLICILGGTQLGMGLGNIEYHVFSSEFVPPIHRQWFFETLTLPTCQYNCHFCRIIISCLDLTISLLPDLFFLILWLLIGRQLSLKIGPQVLWKKFGNLGNKLGSLSFFVTFTIFDFWHLKSILSSFDKNSYIEGHTDEA